MKLTYKSSVEMSIYNAESKGKIHALVVEIRDVKGRVQEMISAIAATSWLESLDIIDRVTYEARAQPTVNRIVNEILNKVESKISEECGEFMISETAQAALVQHVQHVRAPLAELIKEKILGNPGFDFHTETPDLLVVFGEAKYSCVENAHGRALRQIGEFIEGKKDLQECSDLRKFLKEGAILNAVSGKKSFCAAFSIISDDLSKIMDNAINSIYMKSLLCHEEVYLIGIKIHD